MPRTERFRKPGDSSITLRPSTPWSVLNTIQPRDHIVITPQRITTPTDLTKTNLLAFAKLGGFTMVYLRRSGAYTLSGPDASYWLGGGEGYPNPIIPDSPRSNRIRTTAATITTWLNGIFPAGGITLGTVTNGNTTTGAIPYPSPVREALDDLCELTGTEWRIRHDFTLDVGPTATLHPTTPTVIITRDKASTEGALRSVEATTVQVDIDASRIADAAIGYGRGTDANAVPVVRRRTHTPLNVRNIDPAGGTPDLTILADLPNTTPANLNAAIDRVLAEYRSPAYSIRVNCRAFNAAATLPPGAHAWAWLPLDGVYDLANQIAHRGQIAFPALLRAAAVTTPVTSEQGVYALCNNGATIIDLTPWVQWEDGADTLIELSTTGRQPGAANISTSIRVMGDDDTGGGARASQVARASRVSSDSTETPSGWSPTWTNLTIGTGGTPANAGRYSVDHTNDTMMLEVFARLGNTGSVTGEIRLALPSGWKLRRVDTAANPIYGVWRALPTGRAGGFLQRFDDTTLLLTDINGASTSATVPGTWTAGSTINIVQAGIPVEPV